MPAEIGQFAIILAFVVSAVQVVASLWGAHRTEPSLMALGRAAALVGAGFVVLAFLALAWCYVSLDFSVRLVAEHSNLSQPLVYRLGATWGSHEGSMLLWVLILAVYSAGMALFGGALREGLQARVIGVQGLIALGFLGFLIFTSNPFLRLDPAPVNGVELNPLLQDPGLVFHPPMLYLGYVGFSTAFAFAIAALIEGRVDAAWGRWVRPWVLAAWICLTLGITFGSMWSYYVLGWGGWWAWDPVENASFMPWLMGTALLHSALTLERRGALISWTILLAILAFSLSLVGTFLVRSGVLTSVHAFAVDPGRGLWILILIGVATGLALALFAWRAPAFRSGALFGFVSREAGIIANNILLVVACLVVFLGVFGPLFAELMGDKVSVGAPYFDQVFTPFAVVLLALVGYGPLLNWKRDDLKAATRRLRWPLIAAAVCLAAGAVLAGPEHALHGAGIGLGVLLILGALVVIARRYKREGDLGRSVARLLRTTPLAVFGLVLAHAGLGVSVIGISAVSAFQTSQVQLMSHGNSLHLGGEVVRLDGVLPIEEANYQAERASFTVTGPFGDRILASERRFYPSSQTQTTHAAIGSDLFGNTLISIGDISPDGRVLVRMWRHPFVGWIWAGGMLMALGGMASLVDRRWRFGAARKAQPMPAHTAEQAA